MFLQLLTPLSNQQEKITMNGEFIASVVLTGLVVVFIALILLVLFVSLSGLLFKRISFKNNRQNVKKQPVKAEKSQLSALVVEDTDGITDEVVAVITAAVAAMTASTGGSGFVIKSIKQSKPLRNAWATAGLVDNTRPF